MAIAASELETILSVSRQAAAEASPLFPDRQAAGELLARKLTEFRLPHPFVIAIPKGGIPVALPMAKISGNGLPGLCFAVKIPLESSGVFGMGALNAAGDIFLNQELLTQLELDDNLVTSGINSARTKVAQNVSELSGITPQLPELHGRTAVIVDDGLASGFTMLAAVRQVERLHPDRIIAAAPVAGAAAITHLNSLGIETVILHVPPSPAFVIDKFYSQFDPVTATDIQQSFFI